MLIMPERIIKVSGANEADLQKRAKVFELLNEEPTVVLERLAELSTIPKAKATLKSFVLFNGLKLTLGKK